MEANDLSKRNLEVKDTYNHIMRAKLYGVLAINTMEGINCEIDNLLPYEMEKDNIDILSDQFKKYSNGILHPTSYGDHMDRAIKSLSKDLGIAITVELMNTQAVKKVLTKYIRGSNDTERQELSEWLSLPSESIMKSPRFDDLINKTCYYFYKASSADVSDDTISFIRRSANELLRNKASKEAMRKRLVSAEYRADEDIEDVEYQAYFQPAMNREDMPEGHGMILMDPGAMPAANSNMTEMSGININGQLMNIGTYDGMQLGNVHATHQVVGDSAGNVNMSIPMNTISMNLNSMHLQGIPAIPAMPMNLMAMNSIATISPVNLVDGQHYTSPVGQTIEVAMARPAPESSESHA